MNYKRAGFEMVCGTSLQGEIVTDYANLVTVFGIPDEGGDKTDAEWVLRFEDGTVATIYNYKDGKNYCGDDGLPVERITDWHIGGRSQHAADLVKMALADNKPKRQKSVVELIWQATEQAPAKGLTEEQRRAMALANAAPDLLAALERMLDETNAGTWDCLPVDLARSAIAKAKKGEANGNP